MQIDKKTLNTPSYNEFYNNLNLQFVKYYKTLDLNFDLIYLLFLITKDEVTLFKLNKKFLYLLAFTVKKHNIDVYECITFEFNKVFSREGKTIGGTFIKDK